MGGRLDGLLKLRCAQEKQRGNLEDWLEPLAVRHHAMQAAQVVGEAHQSPLPGDLNLRAKGKSAVSPWPL